MEGLSAAYEEYVGAKKRYDEAVEAASKAEREYNEAVLARKDAQEHAFTKLLLLADGRRFALTREYIQRAEPEVLAVLLDSLIISDGNYDLPLHRVAHSVPIAVAGSFLILRMKRIQGKKLPFTRFPNPHAANISVQPDLAELTGHPQWVIERWRRLSGHPLSAEIIDLPTAGLFAEAILGRSNAAEKLNLTRHVAWHELPIPHQPPAIAALTAGSRAQSQDTTPSALPNTINIVNPPAFPEPTGLAEALATLRTADLFRDMSKAGELASIIGNLSQLAGSLGEAATQVTGDAAARALESAGEIGKVASGLANQAMLEGARLQLEASKPPQTSLGSRLNALKEQQGLMTDPEMIQAYEDSIHELLKGGGLEFAAAGRDGTIFGEGPGASFPAPALTVPGEHVSPLLWRDLIEFQVPQDILDMLAARNMSPLSLEAAAGLLVNLDYFPIHVTRFPTVDGRQLTADELLDFIRRNLHTDLMISTALGKFEPYGQEDEQIWISDNPYKSVLRIDLLGPDNAAVVCAKSAHDHWIFHTIATPDTGKHPVSGQRMFGYWSPAPSEFVFYTRGADRATGSFDRLLEQPVFDAGAAIWASFRARVFEFVNENGGEASLPSVFSFRYRWADVVGALYERPDGEIQI